MAGLTALLLLCHVTVLVSAVLLPPTNIVINSQNFQHILTWEEPNNESDIFYQVYYQENSKALVPKISCFNITSRHCDLTKDFTDLMSEYTAIVRSFTKREISALAPSASICPVSDTRLGPPVVTLVPCDHCIEVSINPPISHLWSEEEQRNISMADGQVYPIVEYIIDFGSSAEARSSIRTENATVILKLMPNTNYCVSVDISTSLNSASSIPSAQKCVTTGPIVASQGAKPEVIIPLVVAVLLFFGIVVILVVLDITGYICKRKSFFPKVLKSFSHSERIYSGNIECISPTCTPVEIESQKLEVKESQKPEGLYNGGGYYASRKKLLDGDSSTGGTGDSGTGGTSAGDSSTGGTSARDSGTGGISAGDSSGPILSSNSLSVESSGQMNGSPEQLSTTCPIDEVIISHSAGTFAPVAADTSGSSSDLPFNNNGGFNVNLNSICIGASIDLWTGLNHGGSLREEPKREPDLNSGQTGLSLNGDPIICTSNVLVDLGPTTMAYGSEHYEEDVSDNADDCDADDHVSGYMRR